MYTYQTMNFNFKFFFRSVMVKIFYCLLFCYGTKFVNDNLTLHINPIRPYVNKVTEYSCTNQFMITHHTCTNSNLFPCEVICYIRPPPHTLLKFPKHLRISLKIIRSVPRYYENGVVSTCKCLIIILKMNNVLQI